MLGRTLICQNWLSKYYPVLKDSYNCLLVDKWSDLGSTYDQAAWNRLAQQSMLDYKTGWSLRAQVRLFIARARGGHEQDSTNNRNNRTDGVIPN